MKHKEGKRNRNVLITGGCGYLGSQLARDLAEENVGRATTIRILDNLSSGRLEALQYLPAGQFEFVEGDILDPSSVRQALTDVETVFHLAAIARTPFGFQNPDRLEQVNHWGTAQIVEACLELKVKHLVFASSAAVYGPGKDLSENSPMRPLGPYGQSKVGAERVISGAASRGLKVAVVRLGSLFGLAPVTRFEAVANRFAYLAGVGRPIPIFGTGEQRRPMLHVRDASQFLARIAAKDLEGLWNLASINPSVNDVAETLKEVSSSVRVHHTETDHLTHLSIELETTQVANSGWRPRFSLSHGLSEVVKSFARVGQPMAARHEADLRLLT